jgi:hypothetical protein
MKRWPERGKGHRAVRPRTASPHLAGGAFKAAVALWTIKELASDH